MSRPKLKKLKRDSPEYNEVRQAFSGTWYHPGKGSPQNVKILKVIRKPNNKRRWRFSVYRHKVEGHLGKFKASRRGCALLKNKLCLPQRDCQLCKTIGTNIKRRKGSFGSGIYVTPTSSRAHSLAEKGGRKGQADRALLLAKVIVGKAYLAKAAKKSMRKWKKAPRGHDSVLAAAAGLTSANVQQGQYVVYSPDAVLPAYVVVYRMVYR